MSKRANMDVMKLMTSDYDVVMGESGSMRDFYVKFCGPKESCYEGGIWKIHVTLPENYPYKSPSIGFCNTCYHPNIDESSGSVCLDVINQSWSPMFALNNIFDVFLPQLLMYPNPSDPLNGDAAGLLLQDKDAYYKRVKDYVKRYASVDFKLNDDDDDDDDDEDMIKNEVTMMKETTTPPGSRAPSMLIETNAGIASTSNLSLPPFSLDVSVDASSGCGQDDVTAANDDGDDKDEDNDIEDDEEEDEDEDEELSEIDDC